MRRLIPAALLCTLLLCSTHWIPNTAAFEYSGGGVEEGIEQANDLSTGGTTDVRETITSIMFGIITFLGIIAVLVIVIAGIILVVSGSDEGQRDKAIKMVIYAVVGLLIVLLAGAIVSFVNERFFG